MPQRLSEIRRHHLRYASEVEYKTQRLVNGPHLVRAGHPQARRHSFDGYHSQLIATSIGRVVQPAVLRLQFDMASQSVAGGRNRDDDHHPARSVVENVDRHDRLAGRGRRSRPPLARSSQGVPLVTFSQVLLPQFGIATQTLVIPVEPSEKLLSFQGIDGCVYDVDDGGLTRLGQRLQPLGVWPPARTVVVSAAMEPV